jgi:hypothetical protein
LWPIRAQRDRFVSMDRRRGLPPWSVVGCLCADVTVPYRLGMEAIGFDDGLLDGSEPES